MTAYRGNGGASTYGLPNIAARYDASVLSSITIATGVSQWNDLSGNNNNLLQATTTAQPSYAANTVTFNGTTDLMKTGAFTLVQPETVYAVFKQNTWVLNTYVWDGHTSNSGSLLQANTTPQLQAYAGSTIAFNGGLAVGSAGVVAVCYQGATISFIQVNLNSPLTGSSGAGNMNGFFLGSSASGTSFSSIGVNEVLIFNVAHTATQANQIISFLKGKWGIP